MLEEQQIFKFYIPSLFKAIVSSYKLREDVYVPGGVLSYALAWLCLYSIYSISK